MKIKIDFFSDNFIDAIGAGIYKISIINEKNKTVPLYIGESVFVLVRCATHLYELRKNPNYFGFTDETIENENLTLKFEFIEKICEKQERKSREKEIIKMHENLICQNGISDKMKAIEQKIESLKSFLKVE